MYCDYVLGFMIVSGLFVFCSVRSHLLLTLLGLEFLSLSLYFMFFIYLFYYGLCFYFLLVFLTFVVCEGVLGLGILVCMIRSHGSDSVLGLSILGW